MLCIMASSKTRRYLANKLSDSQILFPFCFLRIDNKISHFTFLSYFVTLLNKGYCTNDILIGMLISIFPKSGGFYLYCMIQYLQKDFYLPFARLQYLCCNCKFVVMVLQTKQDKVQYVNQVVTNSAVPCTCQIITICLGGNCF